MKVVYDLATQFIGAQSCQLITLITLRSLKTNGRLVDKFSLVDHSRLVDK